MTQMSTYSYDQNSHNFPNIFSSLEAYIGEFNLKVNHVLHLTLRLGSDHPNIVPYGTIFQTRDGRPIVLAAGNDRQFSRLCKVLAQEDWALDSRFATNAARVKHRSILQDLLAASILLRDRDPLLLDLRSLQVPAGAVHDMEEALSQEPAESLKLSGPNLQGLRTAAIFGIPRQEELSEPPHLGEHTAENLSKYLGLSEMEIALLVENGVIGIREGR